MVRRLRQKNWTKTVKRIVWRFFLSESDETAQQIILILTNSLFYFFPFRKGLIQATIFDRCHRQDYASIECPLVSSSSLPPLEYRFNGCSLITVCFHSFMIFQRFSFCLSLFLLSFSKDFTKIPIYLHSHLADQILR